MEHKLIALILMPLAVLAFATLGLFIRWLLWKLPDGKLKTFLLTERFHSTVSGKGRYLIPRNKSLR